MWGSAFRRGGQLLLQLASPLSYVLKLLPRFFQHALEVEMVLLGGLENEIDAFDQLVHVPYQLLLKNQMTLIDLFHALSVQPEHPIVVRRNPIQSCVDVLHQLVCELDLRGVELDLTLDNRTEGET